MANGPKLVARGELPNNIPGGTTPEKLTVADMALYMTLPGFWTSPLIE